VKVQKVDLLKRQMDLSLLSTGF